MQYSTTEFETLYLQCFEPSFRLALSLLHEEDDARDVVHEVFLRLWESESRVDNPKAYVVRAVRNSCISRIRHLDVREKVRMKLMLEPPPEEDASEDYAERDAEVLSAIDRLLTFREREVVDKIYMEGKSYKETAATLGVTVASINKNVVGALKKLRNHFKTREQ